MLHYSHVSLTIALKDDSTGEKVSRHLGITPTRIKTSESFVGNINSPGKPFEKIVTHSWILDSPKDASAQPSARLDALVDLIAPISDNLVSLDKSHSRHIDMLFRVSPQHATGVAGEFDWIMISAPTMSKLGAWDLRLSYESIWLDHPAWEKRTKKTFFGNIFGRKRGTRP